MRCETEVRRQQVRMTRLRPKLSEHRPITNIPSPYPADPAACGNRAIRHLSPYLWTHSLCILQKKYIETHEIDLKGLSHEIDYKNFDKNLQDLT
jgi:hypothetical protein